MIAKLAYQCSEFYADAMKLMQLGSIRDLWPRDWLAMIVMKQAAFHGMAEFYQSVVAQQGKCYGEEIARLQVNNSSVSYLVYVYFCLCMSVSE